MGVEVLRFHNTGHGFFITDMHSTDAGSCIPSMKRVGGKTQKKIYKASCRALRALLRANSIFGNAFLSNLEKATTSLRSCRINSAWRRIGPWGVSTGDFDADGGTMCSARRE